MFEQDQSVTYADKHTQTCEILRHTLTQKSLQANTVVDLRTHAHILF